MNIFKKIFGNNQNDKKEVITMTNTEKAIALINTFATGDTEKASELLAENYIQHNLAYTLSLHDALPIDRKSVV